MSIWTSLEAIGHNILASVGRGTLAFFGALASSIESQGGTLLVHLAQDAVVAAELKGGTGAEKFDAAKNAIISALATEGVTVAGNVINGTIEAAVANLKAEPGVLTQTPTVTVPPLPAPTAAPIVNTTASLRATGGDLGSVANQATGTIDGGALGADSVSG